MAITDQMYELSDWSDDATSPQYVGYLNERVSGAWAIKKMTTSADPAVPSTVRWCKGQSGYTTNWENRGALNYDTYDKVFQ